MQYSSIHLVKREVNSIRKDSDSELFLISVISPANNAKKEKDVNNAIKKEFKARYLVIATGVEQVKPGIKDFDKFLGKGIWHCPHCDGFATTNKKLIIIASHTDPQKAIKYAKVFLGWTNDITLFLQSSLSNSNISKYLLNDKQRKETTKLGIKVIEDDWIVKVVENPKTNDLSGVLSKKSIFHKADVLFYHMGISINNKIPLQRGCIMDKGYVKVNEKQQTSVSKVYAVGDIDRDRHYAILASASGAIAAQNIYQELLRESISIKKRNVSELNGISSLAL